MNHILLLLILSISYTFPLPENVDKDPSIISTQSTPLEISEEQLRDKIRGGLLGQLLGNLNGIPHEFKYIDEPGNVADYVPALPEGARTDDDTDFEWVYIYEMQQKNTLYLSSDEIATLWKDRINRRIWCSNQYARQLMDLDMKPPLTGNVLLNPWADFNISGQFLCETFGLLGPGMPQTASKIGLTYTRVAIDGEPAQTTQLFNTMIAVAFHMDDIDKILDAGVSALDPNSELVDIIQQVRNWHQEFPNDWKATRKKIKDTYYQVDGAMRDRNGYELNTAATIAALLYGQGDFALTLQHGFNYGWDCDNIAATAGTIIGTIKGYRWMMAQGWQIVDRYKNTTRDQMPQDETITSFADRLFFLAEKVIMDNGGKKTKKSGQPYYMIQREAPSNVAPFYDMVNLQHQMIEEYETELVANLKSNDVQTQARGTYMAICLGLADQFKEQYPMEWTTGIQALQAYDQVIQVLFFHSPVPNADPLREQFIDAGIVPPGERRNLW